MDHRSITNHLAVYLGLHEDSDKICEWVLARKQVVSAVLIHHLASENSSVVFIQLSRDVDINGEDFLHGLRNDMYEELHSYLIPEIFCVVDELPTSVEAVKAALNASHSMLRSSGCNLDFYTRELKNAPRLHDLPTNKPRQVGVRNFESFVHATIDLDTTQGIDELCTIYELNRVVVLLGLFTMVLSRYSRQETRLLGIRLADKGSQTAPVDQSPDRLIYADLYCGESTFLEYMFTQIARLRQFVRHTPVDLPGLLQQLGLCAQADWNPIVQLGFNFLAVPGDDNNAASILALAGKNETFDLELLVISYPKHVTLSWRYNANVFARNMIGQMAESYLLLLTQILSNPKSPLGSLKILDESKIIDSEAAENNPGLAGLDVYSLFETSVLEHPEKIAVIFGKQNITYVDLQLMVQNFADYLRRCGVTRSDRCAIYMSRSPSFVACVLAIIKTGAVYVPLDPNFPPQHRSFVLADAEINFIVSDPGLVDDFPGNEGKIMFLSGESPVESCGNSIVVIRTGHFCSADLGVCDINKDSPGKITPLSRETCIPADACKNYRPVDNVDSIGSNGDSIPAGGYIFYTSGSAGEPKGVLLTPRSLVNRLVWMRETFSVQGDARFAVKTSISFVDHLAEMLQPLVAGACAVLLSTDYVDSIDELRLAIDQYQITHITLLPSHLRSLLDLSAGSIKTLKTVISSGEILYQDIALRFHREFGGSARLINLYGSTETGADVTYKEVSYDESSLVLGYFDDTDLSDPVDLWDPLADDLELSRISGLRISVPDAQTYTSPQVDASEIVRNFKDFKVPQKPSPLTEYIDLLKSNLLPYLVDVSSRRFIGHMTSGLPSFIPEFSRLIAKLNQNVVKLETSKGLTFLERQVLAMLHREFYQNDEDFYQQRIQDSSYIFGIITSGGSVSNITALHCARYKGLLQAGVAVDDLKHLGPNLAMQKLGFHKQVILVSRLAHYSLKKAAALLGIGEDGLLIIEQDRNQKIHTAAVRDKLVECRSHGVFVIAIVGIAGATETGTVDPLRELSRISAEFNIHFHVDAAWGGAFMFSETYKYKLDGIESADSITFCAHKQLYLAQGISVCLFKDAKTLFSTSTNANYQAKGGSFDFGQFTLEGSRPAASLMLHAAFHLLAKNGYSWIIDKSMQKTAYFRRMVNDSECFELIGDSDLNIVNYRYIPSNLRRADQQYSLAETNAISIATERIQEEQFFRGQTFVSKTQLLYPVYPECQISVFRVVLGNVNTRLQDLLAVLRDQLAIANEIIEPRAYRNPQPDVDSSDPFDQQKGAAVAIGKPIWNSRVYVLDRYLNLLPSGVIGEIYVAGDCLAEGYIGRAAQSEKRLIANPFNTHPRYSTLYKTGDLARVLADGDIEHLGREDRQVKIDGYRIELQEIEINLCKCKGVKQALAFVERDATQGLTLAAYITSEQLDLKKEKFCDRVKEALAKKLPHYMVPAYIQCVEKLSVLPSGKLSYRRIPPRHQK